MSAGEPQTFIFRATDPVVAACAGAVVAAGAGAVAAAAGGAGAVAAAAGFGAGVGVAGGAGAQAKSCVMTRPPVLKMAVRLRNSRRLHVRCIDITFPPL
jgi:hypothetical protein